MGTEGAGPSDHVLKAFELFLSGIYHSGESLNTTIILSTFYVLIYLILLIVLCLL
jgi:hypothetical protein